MIGFAFLAVILGAIKAIQDTIAFHEHNNRLPDYLNRHYVEAHNLIDKLLPPDLWHRLDLLKRILICGVVSQGNIIVGIGMFLLWSLVFEGVFTWLLKKK